MRFCLVKITFSIILSVFFYQAFVFRYCIKVGVASLYSGVIEVINIVSPELAVIYEFNFCEKYNLKQLCIKNL